MSAIDLDALLELSSDATAKRAEAARLLDVSTEHYRENRRARTREDIATTNAAYSTAIDAFVVANRAAHEAESAMREAATDALPALITRLRAAEARIERVGAILSDEGCDCYCDCASDGHNADCDLCLACRIDREVSP